MKQTIKRTMLLGLVLLLLTACGQTQAPRADAPDTAEPVQLADPWRDCTEAEAQALCPGIFHAPEGAAQIQWSVLEPTADAAATEKALIQLCFELNGLSFTARAKQTDGDATELSGMYYSWTVQDESALNAPTGGSVPCKTYRYIGEDGYADLCTWHDARAGLACSLSVTAKDLDGFDLRAVADAMLPASLPSPEDQRRILEEHRALWSFDEAYTDWYYAFTDLDHNGLMEVLAASTQGSGMYTYAHFYEVLPDGSGVRSLWEADPEAEGPDDWPEIVVEALQCYYDRAADRYYYVCENLIRDGAAHGLIQLAALCLKDGVAKWETLAVMDVQRTEAGERTTYTDGAGTPITEQDYRQAAHRRFAGMEQSELRPDWISVTSRQTESEQAGAGGQVQAYESVIAAYKTAYETGNNTAEYAFSNGLSEYIVGSGRFGYALLDLDADGTAELILADPDAEAAQPVFAIYTLSDGQPVPLCVSTGRSRYYLMNDNRVFFEGSGGAAYTTLSVFQQSGAELVGTEGIITAPDGETGIRFYFQSGSVAFEPRPEDQEIGAADFQARWEAYKSRLTLPALNPIEVSASPEGT